MKNWTTQQWEAFIKVLQWIGLIMMMIGLPISNFFMSLATFWLAGVLIVWSVFDRLTGKPFFGRWLRFWKNKNARAFVGIFFVFGISLLWSENAFGYGLKDLKTKLPILLWPFIFSGIEPFTSEQINRLLKWFIAALVFAITVCLGVYFDVPNWFAEPVNGWRVRIMDVRDTSIFISHIRFSMLIVFGCVVLIFRFIKRDVSSLFPVLLMIYFLYYLWILESMTGIAIISCLVVLYLAVRVLKSESVLMKAISLAGTFGFVGVLFFMIRSEYLEHFTPKEDPVNSPMEFTAKGNRYDHILENKLLENGYYVYLNMQMGEVKEAWMKRSNIHPDSADYSGNQLMGTLIRYLTSKGLAKDEAGVLALSNMDILSIESGIPSIAWSGKNGIEMRLERIFFEYDHYKQGGNPSGHSVLQRLEFWKAGMGIIRQNPLMGVGMGDVKQAFHDEYERINSPLYPNFRLRAHNQWMTVWISCGIFGLLLFIWFFFYPLQSKRVRNDALYVALWTIVFCSFFTEDTLESQAGITLFTFFSGLFLFLQKDESNSQQQTLAK